MGDDWRGRDGWNDGRYRDGYYGRGNPRQAIEQCETDAGALVVDWQRVDRRGCCHAGNLRQRRQREQAEGIGR